MNMHVDFCEGDGGPQVVRLAAAPGESRLVVINLRGAMDGLDAVQPYGDPALRALRGTALSVGPAGGAHDLDGFFALHPGLGALMPLWRAGQLGFVHAVSTPYRDRRSHFDGQDLLESGSARADRPDVTDRTGFLNRLVGCVPGARMQLAWASGATRPLIAHGPAPFGAWAPSISVGLTAPDVALMERIYAEDPALAAALAEAVATEATMAGSTAKSDAAFVGRQLAGEARIATFAIDGWDTHAGQAGAITERFRTLASAILTLQSQMGATAWARSVVVVVTEFGRTARVNGSGGTDHGTGSVAILAGGAVAGGKVYGRWPGLTDLYAGRDLLPTADVRDTLASICHAHLGIPAEALATVVFPGATVSCALAAA